MSTVSMEQQLVELVAKQFQALPEEINMDTRFCADLGVDSVDLVFLVLAVEEEFGVSLPDNAADRTVGHLAKALRRAIDG